MYIGVEGMSRKILIFENNFTAMNTKEENDWVCKSLVGAFPAVLPLVGVEHTAEYGNPIRPCQPPTRSRLLQPPPRQVLARPRKNRFHA